tara:strand:+ start:177 stop:455 length:279 start_codon:yes stop_codon:yes gene_type:complete
MIDTELMGGMKRGYYWVKQDSDSDWEVTYYSGSHFVWFGICHGGEDYTLEPSLAHKFNSTRIEEPEDEVTSISFPESSADDLCEAMRSKANQ